MSGTQLKQLERSEQLIPCRVCGASKQIEDFYERQVRQDLSAGECKECTKARVRKRARTNPAVQEYDRARSKTPKRKEHLKKVAKSWNKRNPQAYRAHYLVSNAIRDKRLAKEPCVFCGAEKVHAHHKDYSKPLEVIWLCPKCHHRLHALFPETEAEGKGSTWKP